MALSRNRVLQIERLNPEIARLALQSSYGYYDPVFTGQVDKEHSVDTGGFDPADFSRDAIYDADSEVASAGIVGFLPSGLSYSLSGGYAHSAGTRNYLDFDSYKLFAGVAIRQPLLRNFWTDQGRTLIRVNRKLLKISELGVIYLITDAINQVQQAYYELLFAREDLEVRKRLLAAKESTLAGVRRQVEVGALTVLEESLAASQAARVAAELVSSSNSVVQAENILKTLLGFTATNWAQGPLVLADALIVVPELLVLSESWDRGLRQRPDLEQLKQDLERTRIDLVYRRNQLFPSLDIIASYGRRGASAVQAIPPAPASASLTEALEQIDNSDAPSEMVGIVLSTPLSRSRERADYRAGKLLKEQATLRLKQKEELILREVSDALHSARFAWDRATAARRARQYAVDALRAEERKLAAGSSSLFVVLQLQTDLADAESAEVRARADYNKALSQLHFAEGSLAEHSGVSIQMGR
jgi:outer membrane protein